MSRKITPENIGPLMVRDAVERYRRAERLYVKARRMADAGQVAEKYADATKDDLTAAKVALIDAITARDPNVSRMGQKATPRGARYGAELYLIVPDQTRERAFRLVVFKLGPDEQEIIRAARVEDVTPRPTPKPIAGEGGGRAVP
jgi:hypothetical protein